MPKGKSNLRGAGEGKRQVLEGLVGLYRGFGVYDWMMECIRNRAGMVLQ